MVMATQHGMTGNERDKRRTSIENDDNTNSNKAKNIWSKIEEERRRQSSIRSKLHNRSEDKNSSNEFMRSPRSIEMATATTTTASQVKKSSSLPPLPRSISTTTTTPSPSTRRKGKVTTNGKERRHSSSSSGDISGQSDSPHCRGRSLRKSKLSATRTSIPSRSYSEPPATIANISSMIGGDGVDSSSSTTIWAQHLLNPTSIEGDEILSGGTTNYHKRSMSLYSQDSQLLGSNRSTPVSSKHSRKSTRLSEEVENDNGDDGRKDHKRYHRRKSSSHSCKSSRRTKKTSVPTQEMGKRSSNGSAANSASQPNSFAESSSNAYPQSPGLSGRESSSLGSHPSPATTHESTSSLMKPPSSKSNSIASSGRISTSTGTGGSSQQSFQLSSTPEQRRRGAKMGARNQSSDDVCGPSSSTSYDQTPQQTSRNSDERPPPLPLVSSEWCIDSKPSSFLQPPDTRLQSAPTNNSSDDDDEISINIEDYMDDTGENDSKRSNLSSNRSQRSMSASQKITWNSKRVIAQEDIMETEGWVYCLGCTICIMTTFGIAGIILFVFGAWDVNNKDYEEIQSQVAYLSTNQSVFDDPNSPQSLALQWLVYDDEGTGYDITTDTIRREQRYSLAVLYFATSGPSRWINSYQFLSSENECQWNNGTSNNDDGVVDNVAVEETVNILGVTCGSDSQLLARVKIVQNDLAGTIPVELSALSSLIQLNLNSNEILGTIPSDMQMDALQHYDLSLNKISGTFPESLRENSPNLRILDMTLNQLSSTIPINLLTDGWMANLEIVRLGHNRFTGIIDRGGNAPAAQPTTNLAELNLTSNALEGSLEFLNGLSSLVLLDISSNNFFGTVPTSIGESSPELQTLAFADNDIQGSLPESLGLMTDLRTLRASRNSLSGTFPWSALANATTSQLVQIEVSDNSLSGLLPSSVAMFRDLEVVNFGSNQFSGSIPPTIGSLSMLKLLTLSFNKFTGQIPTDLGILENIISMDLSGNSLTGNIPTSIGEIQSLHELALNSNSLTGSVPMELGDISGLGECSTTKFSVQGDSVQRFLTRLFSIFYFTTETLNLHDNALRGDLDFFCENDPIPLISADCAGDSPVVPCSCCAVCL